MQSLMYTAGLFFIFAAALVASLGTWLLPIVAGLFYKKTTRPTEQVWTSLEILIPAHKEKDSLPVTIQSLRQALNAFGGRLTGSLKITVALSNWSGLEAEQAAAGADQVLQIPQPGKWQALQELVKNSQAEWVALVDAGMTWPADLLSQLQKNLSKPDVIAINPRYQELSTKLVQKLVWGLEAELKTLENAGGGPISLHGATIFYRREPLQKAFAELQGQDWLNDDVVVPLTLRVLYPQSRIIYMKDAHVIDQFPSSNTSEVQRRKRVLFGNIQWIRRFFPFLLKKDPLLAVIALRRVFRMMWAWWGALAGLGLGLLFFSLSPSILLQVFVLGGLGLMLVVGTTLHSGRRLLEAFFVSLLFPYYYFSSRQGQKLQWK